ERLGADVLVHGAYLHDGVGDQAPLRVDLVLQPRAGVPATVSETGTATALLPLVERGGLRLRALFGLPSVSDVEAPMPANLDAARAYAEGLARWRAQSSAAARSALETAIAKDPGFAPAYAHLALVLNDLGYIMRAREEAARALAMSASLPE